MTQCVARLVNARWPMFKHKVVGGAGVVVLGMSLLGACTEGDQVAPADEGFKLNRASLGAQPASNRYIVAYRDAAQGKAALGAAGARVVLELPDRAAAAAEIPSAAVAGLRNHPAIDYIEEDAVRAPLADGSAETPDYGIALTNANIADGAGDVLLCIIDSGYAKNHIDLQDTNVAAVTDPGSGDPFDDQCGHGTHVAGIISAIGGNGVGVAGVNPNGNLALKIVKVFSGETCDWTYSSTLVAALGQCRAGLAPGQRLVVNMSLGGSIKNRFEETAFKDADAAGVLSIAAAGNDGNTRVSYPAGYASVLSVAAIDASSQLADFSQRNADVELAAPGVGVASTVPWHDTATLTAGLESVAGYGVELAARGSATGALADGGDCTSSGDWTGKIVLCERGTISFFEKVSNAAAGGAAGVVIYNNVDGELLATLGDGNSSTIPAIGLSQSAGAAMIAHVGEDATLVNTHEAGADGWEAWDGTSMATPYVAGIAAKIWKHKATASNSQVRWALDVSARDLGVTGRDSSFGFGLVQADAALARLQGPSCKAAGDKCTTATATDCCSLTCSGKTASKMTCK